MSSLQHQLQLICLVALGLGPVIPVTSLATPTIFREEVNLEHCQIQQFHIPINEHCQEEEVSLRFAIELMWLWCLFMMTFFRVA